jgi:predicted transcriptional regulator
MLLYKGDIKDYKESLGLKEKDTPYFFVLDKEGKILYVTSGAYTDAKIEQAEEFLEDATK